MKFEKDKIYKARVKTEEEYERNNGILDIEKYRNNIYNFKLDIAQSNKDDNYFKILDNGGWLWHENQLEFLDEGFKKDGLVKKSKKRGFTIELCTSKTKNSYTVFFEEKHDKVVYCNIYDKFLKKTFTSKAVKHNDDTFDIKSGRKLAFERALEKRYHYIDRMILKITKELVTIKSHELNIESKAIKFIDNN